MVELQNKIVIDTWKQQSALIKSIIRQDELSISVTAEFPIRNHDQLNELNNRINENNCAIFVSQS